jgi:DNA-directed RNA polymerase subunit RPC12/RpoP
MASSISSANVTNFDSDPDVTFRTSDDNYDDMAVVTVKEEALSDDESILNCDSIDDFYEFADTSLPVDVECSELVKDNVIQATNKTPKYGSIIVSLLTDSTLKSYQQMYRDGTALNTVSKSSLKFHLIGNKNGIEKYQQQSKLTMPLKVDREEAVHLEPQKSQTIKKQVSQPVEHQFKCLQCSKIFELKSQLEMHEIGHKQFKSCSSSFPRQEVITVKEEVLSDDEVAVNDASANEYCNIEGTSLPVNVDCLEIENRNSVCLGNNTSDNDLNVVNVHADSTLKNYHGICNDVESGLGSDSKLVKLYLAENKDGIRKHEIYTTNFGFVNRNVKNVMQQQQFKMKPKIARCYETPSIEHRFKCQECSATFELKSYLVNHEISHEQYRRYKPPPTVDNVKQSLTTNFAGPLNVNVKKVVQQQHERKPRIAPSSLAMRDLLNRSYRTNYLKSVKVNEKKRVRRQRWRKIKPVIEHRFKCQECSETFELKSCLVMHEISHERCRKYNLPPMLDHMKWPHATYSVGSVNMNDKKVAAATALDEAHD